MAGWKKTDLVDSIPPRDMQRFTQFVGKLQERNYAITKAMVMKAMIRLFMDRYLRDGSWSEIADVDAAIKEISDVSRD